MEYKDLEKALREEADQVLHDGKEWNAVEVARRLNEIANVLTGIRLSHEVGIDASLGKRSGWKVDI